MIIIVKEVLSNHLNINILQAYSYASSFILLAINPYKVLHFIYPYLPLDSFVINSKDSTTKLDFNVRNLVIVIVTSIIIMDVFSFGNTFIVISNDPFILASVDNTFIIIGVIILNIFLSITIKVFITHSDHNHPESKFLFNNFQIS